MITTATLFRHGRGQAVRLPPEFRFEGDRVRVRRAGRGVVVEPIPLSQLPEQMTAEWQVCDLTDACNPVSFRVARLPFVRETVVSFPRAGLEALARGLQKAGLDASTFVWPPEGEPGR